MSLLASTALKFGGSLLGGLFGRKSSKPQYVVPDYGKIRSEAEAAGFNPLTALTSAPGAVASGGQNYMGSAIADAALHLADGFAASAQKKGEEQRLREENAELEKKVQDLTIRPRVGGIYSGNVSTPSLSDVLWRPGKPAGASWERYFPGNRNGGSDGSVSGGGSQGQPDNSGNGGGGSGAAAGSGEPADVRPLSERLPVDPRREVDNAPVNTTSGFMVVDNPHLDFPIYVPTADGDEPLQWYDYPSLAAPVAGSYAYHKYNQFAERHSVQLGPKRSTNDMTFGDQGYPRGYARPPGSRGDRRASGGDTPPPRQKRQHLPYINYPMYPPTPFVGAR